MVAGIHGDWQGEGHALLDEGSDEHHDDEQHQHDVHERRDVNVGLDAGAGTQLHCHGENSGNW